jgi:single-stranded-DNA-specific exonuclease
MPSLVWDYQPCDDQAVPGLASALGVTPLFAKLLVLRGLADPDEARRFLAPSLADLHDPWRLADMEAATERLLTAIARRERIAIHGDYDVDGITATVILRRALELLGGEVVHFIPDRIRDGYGMRVPAIERLHAEGVQLIVSVDCGIRGQDAARRARDLGVDLIVTDHHEPDEELPVALAVLNPKRHDCTYPDKNLAGVGVVLKLVQALCRRTGHEAWLPAFVKIAAIGTLADVVPVVGENRIITKLGLDMLSRGPHKVGLRALLEVAGLAGRPIDAHQVTFMLAPRMNAAGRMSTPDLAMRLLLASDEAMEPEARRLAQQLDAENQRRQREEQEIVAKARLVIERNPEIGARSVLVVGGDGWHRGVIGIVASKLMDTFHRPVVVLSIDQDVAHGSCRSIPAFDILAALEACRHHLMAFGGHKLAAGLTLEASKVPDFRNALCARGDELLQPDDLRPRLRVDAGITFRSISGPFLDELRRLAPFGPGNPRPMFHATDVEIVDGPRRIKDRHLKMTLRQDGRILRAIAWRAIEREPFLLANREGLHVAFGLEENTYNGEQYVELSLADVRTEREEEGAAPPP